MGDARTYLAGLAQLSRVAEPEQRRASWRQGIATLATMIAGQEAAPLEGLSPEGLLAGVRVALGSGFVDDLGWLSPGAASRAVFELASALPPGAEKRELGRRVLGWLNDGDLETFVALATSLALGSRRPFPTPAARTRAALLFSSARGGTQGDALALALLTRRDLEREWLTLPAQGALPSRRQAARLLERAARAAFHRAEQGDAGGLAVLARSSVRESWSRLLADREVLVWRHAAIARGLVAREMAAEIEGALSPSLSATLWRRAATSLAASIAVSPEGALARCQDVLAGDIVRRDPGVARAMMLGLPRAAEVEPETAEALAEALISQGGLDAVQGLADVRRDNDGVGLGLLAERVALEWLENAEAEASHDDGRAALISVLQDEIVGGEGLLVTRLSGAVRAFVDGNLAAALAAATQTLAAVEASIAWLDATPDDDVEVRRRAFRALRELDQGILETGALPQLLALGDGRDHQRLTAAMERLESWLLTAETTAPTPPVAHATLRLQRLRTLIHIVDAEPRPAEERAPSTRRTSPVEAVAPRTPRRLRALRTLFDRARADRSPLRRAAWAALARNWDAALREELCEISDLLLGVAEEAQSVEEADLVIVREASMVPEVERALCAWIDLRRAASGARQSAGDRLSLRHALTALDRLATALSPTSPRVEALRTALLRFVRSLREVSERVTLTAPAIDRLEATARSLGLLVLGARRRLALSTPEPAPADLRHLSFALERKQGDLVADLAQGAKSLAEALPAPFADLAVAALACVFSAPAFDVATTPTYSEPALPSWLPASRAVGGFHVVRPIGTGAAGSVFVAVRNDERHDTAATRFALKVPDYDGGASRTLSEDEFLRLFREEAGALLAIPPSPHLAQFVTFDAGSRPKPVLVMELVEGPTLERLLEAGEVEDPMRILDGIAAGLEAMHGARVAHLDLKPANIILRAGTPVLVDFGLAGRHLRPGCGSPHFGAPEVWGETAAASADPTPADVYAFGCLAAELLLGEPLLDGDSALDVVTAHLGGAAARRVQEKLAGSPQLGAILAAAVARDPAARPRIGQLRAWLADLSRRAA
jgi:eukaryotic-like serine/threonine-protein kinase